jgi:hypothetical protein
VIRHQDDVVLIDEIRDELAHGRRPGRPIRSDGDEAKIALAQARRRREADDGKSCRAADGSGRSPRPWADAP